MRRVVITGLGAVTPLGNDVKQKYLDAIPLAKFGETDQIADVVAFLASDMSSYVTGQVINVDGGLVM